MRDAVAKRLRDAVQNTGQRAGSVVGDDEDPDPRGRGSLLPGGRWPRDTLLPSDRRLTRAERVSHPPQNTRSGVI